MAIGMSCKKNSSNSVAPIAWDGNIIAYPSVPVTKTNSKLVFAHYMPWFETASTSGTPGTWGLHWTMANENPNIILT